MEWRTGGAVRSRTGGGSGGKGVSAALKQVVWRFVGGTAAMAGLLK